MSAHLAFVKPVDKQFPRVTINLDKQNRGLGNKYTTSDRVEGTVTITVDEETHFSDLDITFEGTSTTTTAPASSIATTSESIHKFLNLRQPISESAYPTPRVLRPGHCYKYPFIFVIPQYLLPQSCTHDINYSHIKQAHLKTPPTLDDPQSRKYGSFTKDMAPGNCHVSYAVRVLLSKSSSERGKMKTLSNYSKSVCIIPTTGEPLCLDPIIANSNFSAQSEQDIRQGFGRHILGRMVVKVSQLNPVLFQHSLEDNNVSTTVQIYFRFNPVLDVRPPQPKEISAKLHAHTFYGMIPWEDYPAWTDQKLLAWQGREAFTEKLNITSFGTGSLEWVKHTCRANKFHTDNTQKELLSGLQTPVADGSYYTASIVLPISLPKNKAYIPTFHSCLISPGVG